jgi:hypothetical protein
MLVKHDPNGSTLARNAGGLHGYEEMILFLTMVASVGEDPDELNGLLQVSGG